MIDLHCHILPGLDDGALDLTDSLAMARQAQADGIATVCATPHIRHDHAVAIDELPARVGELQTALDEEGIDVRIVPGGELAATQADRLSDDHLRHIALGGAGGWLLLEPAPGPLTVDLEDLVQRLAARGLHTVVAHPERHAGADFEERLRALRALGCLIQWTAAFVAAAADGELTPRLTAEGLVDVLGSDAHSSHGGRPVHLSAGYARLAEVCSPARLRWITTEAPEAILRGRDLVPPP
ncbi:MAG TPA: CpsB/CapC family capsule biosynthesis tyrosine phosphatase [Solirubrobacteraceae bacterium]|nr:CpsB/CapC family capsule biosynthesis tyrosine phosphatase [Solirubrobacteraceae bacterium]